jgi:hypothetical protein
MTQKEAKDLTLELWGYIAEHPEERYKQRILARLDWQTEDLLNDCPLCELFYDGTQESIRCPGCPLEGAGASCLRSDSPYEAWRTARRRAYDALDVCRAAARRIVEIVSAWEPKEKS